MPFYQLKNAPVISKLTLSLFISAHLISAPLFADNATENILEKNTEQGLVQGFESDLNTLSWHGIPFAKPPLGELRWKAPRPPKQRQQTLLANNNKAMCLQKAGPLVTLNVLKWNSVIGDEDCLYLNITAPKDLNKNEKLPVMFWIHGGGNSIGSKGNRAYTGEQLTSQGRVILVTVNYRLGPMGWFLHPALQSPNEESPYNLADISGNYGTLDLIEALKWTQANIENFGGMPNNITVFGESAGGFNTYSLLASPLAKGLFQRAIVESGGFRKTTSAFAKLPEAQGGHSASGAEIANKILINTKQAKNEAEAYQLQKTLDPDKLAEILINFDGKSLVDFYTTRAAGMLEWPGMNTDGFVIPTTNIQELFKNTENYNAMPIMLGTNRDENKTFLALNPELVSIGFRIKDKEKYNRTAKYLADNWKLVGVDENARILSESQGNIYAYRFDWDELPNIGYIDLSELIGAGHGLEIPFVFGGFKSDFNLDLLFGEDKDNRRQKLSDAMMSYWTNFAYTGNPSKGRNNELPEWSAWNNAKDGGKFILLDAGDSAIKMSKQEIYRDELKARLAKDTNITEQAERCELYKSLFVPQDLSAFDKREYLEFGKKGCKQFPL